MARQRIAVLMGGISSEHEVSLRSGAGMLRELDRERYVGFPVLIAKDNTWHWPARFNQSGSSRPNPSSHPFPVNDDEVTLALSPDEAMDYLQNPPQNWVSVRFPNFTSWPNCDIALLALHGIGGEDGRLQGFFEMAGQAFTGSGSFGAALAMDKIVSKQLYQTLGIPTAPFVTLSRAEREAPELAQRLEDVVQALGLPLLVKHPKGGSSLGMGIARDRESLIRFVQQIGSDGEPLLLEAFVKGREVTCGVLEGKPPLFPTEIRPRQDAFFTYEAKYQTGRTEEITPAPMPDEVLARIQDIAWKCHRGLRLAVYSRTDMMVTDSEIFVLETNNLPGFTPTSILPQQALHASLSYRDLLTHILETSWERFHPKRGAGQAPQSIA